MLIHNGLVAPYANIDLGNNLLPDATKLLPEPMLTWSLVWFCGIQLRANSQQVLQHYTEIEYHTFIKLLPHLPGANEFSVPKVVFSCMGVPLAGSWC